MKTLIITLGILILTAMFVKGLSYLYRPTIYTITATSITTGERIIFQSANSYKTGDTTFKEKYYSVVNDIK